MPPTGHDYVTQRELDARLDGQAEMRQMVSRQIEQLMKGQGDLSHQLYAMENEIVGQMRLANGRTGKLEDRLEKAEELLESGKEHIADVEDTVHKILEDGCHQIKNHAVVIDTLESVGAIVPAGGTARVEFADDRPLRTLVRQHPKKTVAVGSGALVGLGALVPHFIQFIDWFVHLFVPGVK